jgi:hypothetical protein
MANSENSIHQKFWGPPTPKPKEEPDDFYVCPNHVQTGGWESCCSCGGWKEGEPNYGRICTEAEAEEDNSG